MYCSFGVKQAESFAPVQVKERLIQEDDVIIDAVLEKTSRLYDVTAAVVQFYNVTQHDSTRDLLLTDVCALIRGSLTDALSAVGPRACAIEDLIQVRALSGELNPGLRPGLGGGEVNDRLLCKSVRHGKRPTDAKFLFPRIWKRFNTVDQFV